MAPKRQGLTTLVVLALFVAGMLASGIHTYWRDFWLTVDGKETVATLIVPGSKPGAYVYSYTVNSIRYNGEGNAGVTLDQNAHVGAQIFIFVSSSHPWLSSGQIPNFSIWQALICIALFLVIEFYIIRTAIRLYRGFAPRCVKAPHHETVDADSPSKQHQE